jgi:hypothetical protein
MAILKPTDNGEQHHLAELDVSHYFEILPDQLLIMVITILFFKGV